jgi:hypothetical protein
MVRMTTDSHEDGSPKVPLFPRYFTKSVGWIEAKRIVGEGEQAGTRTIARRFEPETTEVGMAEELMGGHYSLRLCNKRGEKIVDREFVVEGPEKKWPSSERDAAAAANANGNGLGKPGELFTGLAALFASMHGGQNKACDRCSGMILQMQAVQAGANDARAAASREVDDMRRRHNDEVDRLRERIKELEKKIYEKDSENLGLSKTIVNSSGGASQIVRDAKEMAPHARQIVGAVVEGFQKLRTGGGAAGAGAGRDALPTITISKLGQ